MSESVFRRRAFLRASALAAAAPWLRHLDWKPAPRPQEQSPQSFAGPFPSWSNLKEKYGAAGDGVADDTAAFQAALDELGDAARSPVVWIPEGTFRITRPLRWARRIGEGWMNILGDHPATTRIVWDGPANGIMLTTHDVNNARFGRISWDGAGRAGIAVQHTSSGSSSGNEHADEAFVNVGIGICGGTMDTKMVAEMSVLRCTFRNCSRAGISLQNSNAVDWWIWYSKFDSCYVGVTSGYGQGGFHVFNSVFKDSAFADTVIAFATNHVLADNYSRNSRAFCLAGFSQNQIELVIQRNAILDPVLGPNPPPPAGGGLDRLYPYELRGPIAVKYLGPLVLLDNVIRSRPAQSGPVVEIGEDMVAVGNTFTVDRPLLAGKRLLDFDNRRMDLHAVQISEPILPPTPTRDARAMLEVALHADAAQIQAQINAAHQMKQRAVVHIPFGEYALERALIIPEDSDIQLVGDGRTILRRAADSTAPVIEINQASRAVLADLVLQSSAPRGSGLIINGVESRGIQVLMQGVQVRGATYGLHAEGIRDGRIELRDFQSVNANLQAEPDARRAAVQVTGQGGTAVTDGQGGVFWFSGASSGRIPTFGAGQAGALFARAIWYEGSAPYIARFEAELSFTLMGGLVARAQVDAPPAPAFAISNVRGRVSIISVNFADATELAQDFSALEVSGNNAGTRVLALGVDGSQGRVLDLRDDASAGEVGFLICRSMEQVGTLVTPRADEYRGAEVAPHRKLVLEMLEQARRAQPLPLAENAPTLYLSRVYVLDFETAIHLG